MLTVKMIPYALSSADIFPDEIWLHIFSYVDYEGYIRNGGNSKIMVRLLLKLNYKMSIRKYMKEKEYGHIPFEAIPEYLRRRKKYGLNNHLVAYNRKMRKLAGPYSVFYVEYAERKGQEMEKLMMNPTIDEHYLRTRKNLDLRAILCKNRNIPFDLLAKYIPKTDIIPNLCLMKRGDIPIEYLRSYPNRIDWDNVSRYRKWTLDEIKEFEEYISLDDIIDNSNITIEMILYLMRDEDGYWNHIWGYIPLTDEMFEKFPMKGINFIFQNRSLTFKLIENNFKIILDNIDFETINEYFQRLPRENDSCDDIAKFISKNMGIFDLDMINRRILFNKHLIKKAKKYFNDE